VQAAIDYFAKQGWQIVGDPLLINPNWNGADLVFTMGSGKDMRVLAVELKNITGNVTLEH